MVFLSTLWLKWKKGKACMEQEEIERKCGLGKIFSTEESLITKPLPELMESSKMTPFSTVCLKHIVKLSAKSSWNDDTQKVKIKFEVLCIIGRT
mmetsp:Transcript_2009/g.2606  ORF Transcript_2009/g.2606 Transcript_2009/m.2606 type:complete len:94 (-) Transcript_2009:45-326(-)